MTQAQMTRHLRLAILRLPVHYREAVVLCELNGLSYEEAAAVIGCPIGTVRSRLSRARRMLIERCRTLVADKASGTRRPAEGQRQQGEVEGMERWLTPTKNNC
jgi:DNA-directed RNA polymerase specialized sigma24 family protein